MKKILFTRKLIKSSEEYALKTFQVKLNKKDKLLTKDELIRESNECDGLLICLGDMPFINTSEINKLIHAYVKKRIKGEDLIVVPVFKRQRGNPVLFSIEFRNDILEHKKKSGCKEVIMKNSDSVMEIEMDDEKMLLDVDTMEDYQSVSDLFVT